MSENVWRPDNVVQLVGHARFDMELEGWLKTKGWMIRKNLLADRLEVHRPEGIAQLTEERLAEIRFSFVYATNGKEPAKEKIVDALALIGERCAYHPVRDYLRTLHWDGVPRIDGWLTQYAGAPDSLLTRAYARKILCAAVRRVLKPGCKFDHILILKGAQDLGKSSLIRALCPDPSWFTDQLKVGVDAREIIERASSSWIIELAELDGLGKREANAVKSFVTTVSDRARPAYGRYVVEKLREFVLFGTTNESTFLTDLTGNRRWWVVQVEFCDVAALAADRDQLWAEALSAEKRENLWLDSDELRAAASSAAAEVVDRGPWYDLLADKIPDGSLKIPVADAWALVGILASDINRISPQHRTQMRKAMAGLGFGHEPRNLRRQGRQTFAFVRGDVQDANWWPPPC